MNRGNQNKEVSATFFLLSDIWGSDLLQQMCVCLVTSGGGKVRETNRDGKQHQNTETDLFLSLRKTLHWFLFIPQRLWATLTGYETLPFQGLWWTQKTAVWLPCMPLHW